MPANRREDARKLPSFEIIGEPSPDAIRAMARFLVDDWKREHGQAAEQEGAESTPCTTEQSQDEPEGRG